jgi:hypothetical protein
MRKAEEKEKTRKTDVVAKIAENIRVRQQSEDFLKGKIEQKWLTSLTSAQIKSL